MWIEFRDAIIPANSKAALWQALSGGSGEQSVPHFSRQGGIPCSRFS